MSVTAVRRAVRESVSGLPRESWWLWTSTLVNRLGAFVATFMVLYLTMDRGYSAAYAGLVASLHVHEAWTLLIVDDGAVRYDLDRHEHGTPDDTVSLLPPHVPHNGEPVSDEGFRKRVLYLDSTLLDETDWRGRGRPRSPGPRTTAEGRPVARGARAAG